MRPDPDRLRKQAKLLRKNVRSGDADAIHRVRAVFADGDVSSHARALHVIAREAGFESWPKLKTAAEIAAMDRAQKAERLRTALFHGQHWVAERLLSDTPDLTGEDFGLQCALYDLEAVRDRLASDPAAAVTAVKDRTPILHLAFSKHFETGAPASERMIAVAEALVAAGADVNDSYRPDPASTHGLSALYGALGHAHNLGLAAWLLDHGASPDDNESLYHATELDTLDGLRLLMRHNVRVEGTNALPRMLDFDNYEGVKLLLQYGADPNEGIAPHPSGEPSMVIPALHQAARRKCSGRIIQLLIDHGGDGRPAYKGHSAYALARIYGNREAARVLERNEQATPLDAVEAKLAAAADGEITGPIDPAELSHEGRLIIGRLLGFAGPAPLDHIKRLVAMGIDPDWSDEMDLPAIHLAGWEGHADAVAFLLTLKPDLGRRNGFGGDLLGAILHGAEFNPRRDERDHLRCAELVLEAGAPLKREMIEQTGVQAMVELLDQWAEAHPAQIVD